MAAVTDHLKQASTELMKAADLLRQEIDQLRNEDRDLKKMLERQAVELAAAANLREQEATKSDDDNHKSMVQNVASDLRRQISKVNQQQRDEANRIAQLIRDKQTLFEQISTQARNVMPS